MKIFTHNGIIHDFAQPEIRPIYLDVQLRKPGGWSKSLGFLYDTGAIGPTMMTVPKSLLRENGVEWQTIGVEQSEMADGSLGDAEGVILVTIRLSTIPSQRHVIIQNMLVSVSDTAKTGLINLGNIFRQSAENGELTLLELNKN